jgi:hypothetical protein
LRICIDNSAIVEPYFLGCYLEGVLEVYTDDEKEAKKTIKRFNKKHKCKVKRKENNDLYL